MDVRVAIIPAAGLGTRILPYSKEIPKEMLPVIIKSKTTIIVKPVLHYIFDALYDVGFRIYYFIVGRGKRVIENYFTPDWNYVEYLIKHNKEELAEVLKKFYEKLERSEIVMINQPYPKGFGDAILRTKTIMIDNNFLVHAGDDIVYPDHALNIVNLLQHYKKLNPDAIFLYDRSEHPERYGVVIGEEYGNIIKVDDVIEKPSRPPSNNVIVAIYIFNKKIYHALEKTRPLQGEHQLTDAIRYIIKYGGKVYAIKVMGKRLDLGTPEYYLEALKTFVNENM